MLSLEVTNAGKTIQICCDADGVDVLKKALARLLADPDHVHLRSPLAGGRELDAKTPFGAEAIHEVIITGGDPPD